MTPNLIKSASKAKKRKQTKHVYVLPIENRQHCLSSVCKWRETHKLHFLFPFFFAFAFYQQQYNKISISVVFVGGLIWYKHTNAYTLKTARVHFMSVISLRVVGHMNIFICSRFKPHYFTGCQMFTFSRNSNGELHAANCGISFTKKKQVNKMNGNIAKMLRVKHVLNRKTL